MAFLPTDTIRQLGIQGRPRPTDDWHTQWGGTPEASGPGGGDIPFQAGAPPPPMPDWSQSRGQNQLGFPPGVDWNRGYGPKLGGAAPDWRADLGRGVSQWDQATSAPAPPQSGGGYTPLSQLARGGAAFGLPRGGGTTPGAPPTMAPPGGGLVLLRAPTGQTRQVPGDQVAHYLARGATRG